MGVAEGALNLRALANLHKRGVVGGIDSIPETGHVNAQVPQGGKIDPPFFDKVASQNGAVPCNVLALDPAMFAKRTY
jgi:hypothetical protein